MIRYALFVIAVVGSAATAFAAIVPDASAINSKNVTVIEKNQTWFVVDETTVRPCAKADCSDTPQG
jgi:cation diffusion facilitator CzcD-associated flavoprotein CzcO